MLVPRIRRNDQHICNHVRHLRIPNPPTLKKLKKRNTNSTPAVSFHQNVSVVPVFDLRGAQHYSEHVHHHQWRVQKQQIECNSHLQQKADHTISSHTAHKILLRDFEGCAVEVLEVDSPDSDTPCVAVKSS